MDSTTGESIAIAVAQERRPAAQIGRDIDYVEITRGVRSLLLVVIGMVALLLILSLFVSIEEVARARGEFVPVQRVQVIQTSEGGAIEEILVRNGDEVTQGQLIAKFRNADLARDVQRTEVRLAYLEIQLERLDAFADRRPLTFERFRAQYPQMVAEATSLNEEQERQLSRNLDQKDREIDEEMVAQRAAGDEIPSAFASRSTMRELLARVREGVSGGVIARNRLAQVEEQVAQSERTYTQLEAALDQHRARVKRLEAERDAIIAKATADARNQRADLLVQLDELKAAQAAYLSRSIDTEIRAPIAGIVQKISETPVGTVIQAGGTVCEVVPVAGGVLIQARVSPRDIGFVRIGQKVNVKSDAFDYGRFGSISGKVARIAPFNTTAGNGQEPYFLVEIGLDQLYVGADKQHVVTPGMTGEATILTGEKSIFQYLLKPIYLTLDTALHER